MGYDLRRDRRRGRLESIGASTWLTGPVVVVAIALVAAGWLAFRDVPATVAWLDIGSPEDDAYISGAFPPERNATETYRWTTSSAIVTVPTPSDGRYRLDFSIASTGGAPRTLQVTCPGGESSAQIGTGFTPPSVFIDCQSDGEIPVGVSVPAVRVPGDGRSLGIAIRDVRVTAIDDEAIANWRLRAGLAAAAAIVGIWLAALTLAGRRAAMTAAAVTLFAAIAVTVRRSDWVLSIIAGPAAIITLATGNATWLLARNRRTGPLVLGLIALASWLFIRPVNPVLLLPALWTPHDAAGYLLLPLLVALATVAAALIGGRRAPLLVGIVTLLSACSMLALVAARQVLARWSLVIHGPDWTDVASPVGALLLISLGVITVLALRALAGSPLSSRPAMAVVITLALIILIPWRDAVMNLNGDEPHYYVTAHSLATDADLELLDDYLEPEYLDATISPTGNIAVARAVDADRYAALSPPSDDAWFLTPDFVSDAAADSAPKLVPATEEQPIVVDDNGDRDSAPSLRAGANLAVPISGPCSVESVQIAAADQSTARVTVRLFDAAGTVLWNETVDTQQGIAQLQPPLDPVTCKSDFAGTLAIDADRPVVAQAIDTAAGLRVLAARPSAAEWLLGPLPRDRYATQAATARLVLHNSNPTPVTATVRLATASESLLRATGVTLPAATTIAIDLDLRDAAAVSISASAPVVAAATGWLAGGSYPLVLMPAITSWQFDVPPAPDRDAGIWLVLANPSSQARNVTVLDRSNDTRSICGYCAQMVHLSSGDRARTVSVSSLDGPVTVAAVAYEERTGALHFDLGLPLLAALPIRLGGPDAAPVVSAIATLLLALGLFDLLRRIGVSDLHAVWGAGAVALLAPLSPYAVRLYTEPLAACLVVWSLVCWDRARRRPALAAVTLLMAGALPLIHGRYTPLAFAIALLVVLTVVRRVDVSRRQALALIAVFVALVAVVAVSPLAIALRDRASGGYFSTEWVPRNLLGILLDRGSGLLPFAPWCLLALAAPRRLHPLQRAALGLFAAQLSVVALRAGGWQTFGAPSRYILPVVPLIALLAIPGAIRLWGTSPLPLQGKGVEGGVRRVFLIAVVAWSAGMTFLLHWLPLTGYIYQGRYFIDLARHDLPPLVFVDTFPTVAPGVGSNLLGIVLLVTIWTGTWIGIKYGKG